MQETFKLAIAQTVKVSYLQLLPLFLFNLAIASLMIINYFFFYLKIIKQLQSIPRKVICYQDGKIASLNQEAEVALEKNGSAVSTIVSSGHS